MIIGITGGIGAGKSVVTDWLREQGYAVVDADEVAREAVLPGEPALAALAAEFGPGILRPDGTLDRKTLAALAFASAERTACLNGILHADIRRRIEAQLCRDIEIFEADSGSWAGVTKSEQPIVRHSGGASRKASEARNPVAEGIHVPVVFLSAPLLYESALDTLCDEVWLISAPEDLRVERAAARDGTAHEDIRARAGHQLKESERRARADLIIDNHGDKTELINAIIVALNDLKSKYSFT
jgi:dephospho-CoA kinase